MRTLAYDMIMKVAASLIALLALAVPASAQQAYCPYGQTCPNTNPVPFPILNPLAGLNLLNPGKLLPQQAQQPVLQPTTPTPPPVMPPEPPH